MGGDVIQKLGRTLILCVLLLVDSLPGRSAWAVQLHGGAEGLVSHQLGHVLFIAGMAYMLYHLYHLHFGGSGWPEFKGFIWLIIIWNCLTFTGHWLSEGVAPEKFIHLGAGITEFQMSNLSDIIFYASRLDHLFLVPSFILLLLALKKWADGA